MCIFLGSISLLSRCFNTGRGEASERSEEAGGEGKKKEEEVAGRTRNWKDEEVVRQK